jgi:hypothetical protein
MRRGHSIRKAKNCRETKWKQFGHSEEFWVWTP